MLSNEDKEVLFRKDHWPVNGSEISSVMVLENVTLSMISASGIRGAR